MHIKSWPWQTLFSLLSIGSWQWQHQCKTSITYIKKLKASWNKRPNQAEWVRYQEYWFISRYIQLYAIPPVSYCFVFKGAWSEIEENEFSLNLKIWSLFKPIHHPQWKKLQISISFESNYRKQCLCYLLFLKWWKPHCLISERVFHWFLPNYKEFAHETSHTQPSKYDSNSGTKISIWLKKIGGMRLWIGTSTFNITL